MRISQVLLSTIILSAGVIRVDADALRVVTTTTDLAALTKAVGGDLIEVQAIARGSQDPHFVDARPSFMRRMRGADLLVYNGLELEIGWLPLLVDGSRNRRLQAGEPGALNASKGLPILEIPTVELDRSHGDVHPEGNPHYTLSPLNGRQVALTISTRLQQLLPDHSERIQLQCEQFIALLDTQISHWEQQARPWQGTQVIAHHKQWEYLAHWLGLDIVAYIEAKPGIPPTPRHVSNLVGLIETDEIPIILRSTFTDERPARRLAERTAARVVELPAAVDAIDNTQDYIALFNVILDQLETAISAGDR
jgi:zinc/manganese transport system substrate-binding protein